MGCKASKYAISDGPEYDMEGYKNSGERTGVYPIETDIIQTHRYLGSYPSCDNGSQRIQMQPPPAHQHDSSVFCPSDAQLTQMAENCSVGFLDLFGFGGNKKMITNGPPMVNAYQQPAYNYQTSHSSELSIANSQAAHSRHSQNSQRKIVPVPNGSFSL
jgi:hypothetical protein